MLGSRNWGALQLGSGLPVLTRATWTVNSTPMPTEAMRMTTGMALSLMPISPMMPNSSTAIMARMETWGGGAVASVKGGSNRLSPLSLHLVCLILPLHIGQPHPIAPFPAVRGVPLFHLLGVALTLLCMGVPKPLHTTHVTFIRGVPDPSIWVPHSLPCPYGCSPHPLLH